MAIVFERIEPQPDPHEMSERPKERPILFSGAMVKAILAGTKSVTRRVVKPESVAPDMGKPVWSEAWIDPSYLKPEFGNVPCLKVPFDGCGVESMRTVQRHFPRWAPGDRLWVRETWRTESSNWDTYAPAKIVPTAKVLYDADADWKANKTVGKTRVSIHMPRSASRVTLEVTEVRVERAHDIGKDGRKAKQVLAEGITPEAIAHNTKWFHPDDAPAITFSQLWESINGKGSWAANPWVWCISFRRLTP